MITPQEQEAQRLKVLCDYTPFLFVPVGKRVLYIGGAPGKLQLVKALGEAHDIFLLEGYQPNIQAMMDEDVKLETPNFCGYHCGNVVQMSLRSLKAVFGQIDHVVWWHGPEHIERFELRRTLHTLENLAQSSVVLGCPYGMLEQGTVGGNVYETHKTHLYPGDFEVHGYDTITIGARDSGVNSCLIAWKRIHG